MSINKSLPIYDVIDHIISALSSSNCCVIKASTGAGKSTVVPLKLLPLPWVLGRKIILVEPRRIAARSVAHWMAKSLGENIGQTVGYRVHLDTRVSSSTVIEVVTDGVFLNMLLSDPELKNTACVIFDEFHERSIDLDLSLCLLRESQSVLRDDLKLIVMSATFDPNTISDFLDNTPIVTSQGRSYPVDISYNGSSFDPLSFYFTKELEAAVVSTVIDSLNNLKGSILVFLPGVGEIKRVMSTLKDKIPDSILVLPLYGGLKPQDQEKAISPCLESRKIVLSTSIAESSITIDGVRIVIDSGLYRQPKFNSKNGMDSLETVYESLASADQRAGRAGRVEEGICIRLWENYKKLDKEIEPGILRGDLTSLVLNYAFWGYTDIEKVEWLTTPNISLFKNALELLISLGCIDNRGITQKGRAVRNFPVHPRLGSMIYEGNKRGLYSTTALIAGILSERDCIKYPKGTNQSDLIYRLDAISCKSIYPGTVNKFGIKNIKEYAKSITTKKDSNTLVSLGLILMYAYPDRVAKNMGNGRFITISGAEATLEDYDTLFNTKFIIILNTGGIGNNSKVFLSHPLDETELYNEFSSDMKWESKLIYDKEKSIFKIQRKYKLGAIVLKEDLINKIETKEYVKLLIPYLYKHGLDTLRFDKKCLSFINRVNFLHNLDKKRYPDLSEKELIKDLSWLEPFIITKNIDLLSALKSILSWDKINEIDIKAPTHLKVPSGSNIPLDYSTGEPILSVRLQELFGLSVTPKINNNMYPVIIHLLSPASRPIQITKDLKSFWDNTYIEVKKDLKGRYPKHYWPDNPYEAEPTNRVKKKK